MATNFEFYKDVILEYARKKIFPTVINGKVCECSVENCIRCFFNSTNCIAKRVEWLYAEHIEQPKLTKREIGLCEYFGNGYIARDEVEEFICWYSDEPKKIMDDRGYGYWSSSDDKYWRIMNDKAPFAFIKWEDEKPWAVEDLLKLEVEEDG